MDPSLSSSSTEDVSQLSPAHDNNTEISSSDIIKSKGKAPESSSDNELEAGSEFREWIGKSFCCCGLRYARAANRIKMRALQYSTSFSIDELNQLMSERYGKIMPPRGLSPSTSQKYKYLVKAKAGEDEEKMIEYEAVCLCCSKSFDADNVLKMKCKCKTFALIHDGCSSDYKDCSNCKQPIEYVPVTLLPSEDSHPTSPDEKVDQKCCSIS